MALLWRILLGSGITGLGVLFVLRTDWILDFFGTVDWAERNIGGSRIFYKLLGSFVAIIGFFVMTGLWTRMLEATATSLFGGGR